MSAKRKKSKQLRIWFDPKLKKELERLVIEMDRPQTWIIEKAFEEYLASRK